MSLESVIQVSCRIFEVEISTRHGKILILQNNTYNGSTPNNSFSLPTPYILTQIYSTTGGLIEHRHPKLHGIKRSYLSLTIGNKKFKNYRIIS